MPTFPAARCTHCKRLSRFLRQVKQQHPDYFCQPVPPFGSDDARLCIVGLAPGMHGANATGRPFTGDHAGILLYQTLHRHGFASREVSRNADDGLQLIDCRITNAVKCLPPQNKPVGEEINNCNKWLQMELDALSDKHVVLALGGIAHKAVVKALGLRQKDFVFAHGAEHSIPRGVLIDSYHCSRYNTQTRRLTPEMFDAVFARARSILSTRAQQ